MALGQLTVVKHTAVKYATRRHWGLIDLHFDLWTNCNCFDCIGWHIQGCLRFGLG